MICISSAQTPGTSALEDSRKQEGSTARASSSSQGDHLHAVICNKELSTGRHLRRYQDYSFQKGKGEKRRTEVKTGTRVYDLLREIGKGHLC